MATSTLKVDPVTKILGNFGKWQLTTMLIIFLCKIPTSWFTAIIIYTTPAPKAGDYWCTPPPELPPEYTIDWIARAHPRKLNIHNVSFIDYCEVYTDFYQRPMDFFRPNQTWTDTTNFTTNKCKNFTFEPSFYSMVADFSLVCGRDLWVPLSQVFHIAGLLIGGIVAFFSLKYVSPRNVMLIGISAQIILGNVIGVVWCMEIHAVLRFLTAASCAMMYTAGSMIFVDITNGAAKTIALLVFELFWSFGLIILPLFDLFIELWWKLYIAISLPTVCLVFLVKYLPDSPRWMIIHGRLDEARQILIDGGNKNKRRVPINLEEILKSKYNSGPPKQDTWCNLWDGKPSRIFILAVHYAWSVYVLNFNCIILNIRMYGREHLWINTMVIGFSEIIGVCLGIYIVLYTSRRCLWAGAGGIITGCIAYASWFIPRSSKLNGTADLVSPDRKKMLMFSSTVWARAWFLWCPFIFLLKTYSVVMPLTIFATLSVLGGILMIIVHTNQYKAYLAGCEQRMQAMRAVRTISNAGLDFIKNVRRRSSIFDIEGSRRKSMAVVADEEDSSYERI